MPSRIGTEDFENGHDVLQPKTVAEVRLKQLFLSLDANNNKCSNLTYDVF